ncbi:MAG: DUF421 domain-containing protein [Clostridia bacterium]|nr:DUF421 domain-containing protein [Clostridia bacterium]
MEAAIETLVRTAIGFFILLILIRLLGKKQLGQLTFFTYITGIAMGNIAGDMVVHKDVRLIDGVLGLILWAILTFLVEFVSLKSSKARIMLDGEPTIVIKKTEIVEDALKSLRLNLDDLLMLLRSKDIFSLKDVEYAILEPNGQLSVLKKPELDSVIKKDLRIPTAPDAFIPTEIIVDGKAVTKNLKEFNLNDQWLKNQLHSLGINSVEEVFFAELQYDGSLYIRKKQAH